MGIRTVVICFIGVIGMSGHAFAQSLEQRACEKGARSYLQACLASGIPCVPENPMCNSKPHRGNEAECNAMFTAALNRCQPSFNWKQTLTAPEQPTRYDAAYWRDLNGVIWLFGGADQNSVASNELFTFHWGASAAQTGWQAVASTSGSAPSARIDPTIALDPTSGVLWLFGGRDGANNRLNDLWTFKPATNGTGGAWTQVSTGTGNGFPNYGAGIGVPCVAPGSSPVNGTPGGRYGAVAWVDSSHNLWVFGGLATDCTDSGPYLVDDLWQFTPNAAGNGGTWTWYPTPSKQYYAGGCLPGVIGAATPGGRVGASYWTDANGSLWVFGGLGFGASNTATCQTVGSSPVSGYLNDLWKYANGQWTLVAGPATLNQPGSYGKQGVAAGTNLPPPRFHAAAWQDLRGNFWMFGGANGPYGNSLSAYNDLWEFVYNTKTWIWIGGSQGAVQVGANYVGPGPGPRAGAAGGAIGFADFWVYGGLGENTTAPGPFPNPLNDFWQGVGVVYDWP